MVRIAGTTFARRGQDEGTQTPHTVIVASSTRTARIVPAEGLVRRDTMPGECPETAEVLPQVPAGMTTLWR